MLAAVAVVAAQGGRHEAGISIGARALLVYTLGKAMEAAEAGGISASAAALSLVLYGGERGHGGGLVYVMSGLAAAVAAATGGVPDGEEEGQGDERAAGLLAGAVARGVVAAGSLAAARVRT